MRFLLAYVRKICSLFQRITIQSERIMQVQERIEKKLQSAFDPEFLQVQNESNQHNVPAGSESHFKVVIVSSKFEQKSLLQQHQLINHVLAEELAGPIHALSIQAKTPTQWGHSAHAIRDTPECLGGGKRSH